MTPPARPTPRPARPRGGCLLLLLLRRRFGDPPPPPALIYVRESDHIVGRHELRPPLKLKMRQLRAAGWCSPSAVPFYEWLPLRAAPTHRLHYLQETLAAASPAFEAQPLPAKPAPAAVPGAAPRCC